MLNNPSDPNNNPTPPRGSGRLGKDSDVPTGEIIEQETIRVEGGPQVVRGGPVSGPAVAAAGEHTGVPTGEIIEQETVRIEGGPSVVHGGPVSGPAVEGEVVRREVIPNASLTPPGTRVETTRSEVVHVEAVHAEPRREAGLTQDVFTVGETFDPITHNPCELHGIMVEFEDSEQLLEAVRAARKAGYRKMDCYSPIPVEGLTEEMGWRDKKVPALMLIGGFTGFTLAWLLQFSGMAWFYPVNIGGKPLNSWPQFIVPAFEMTIFFTALSGVVSMLVLNGLPSPYHPVFNAPGFDAASSDRFFLVLEEGGPQWSRGGTLQFARTLGGLRVSEVQR